jgi:hypothetical protein
LAHLFRKRAKRQKWRKSSKFLTVRLAIGHNLTVYFAEKVLNKGH